MADDRYSTGMTFGYGNYVAPAAQPAVCQPATTYQAPAPQYAAPAPPYPAGAQWQRNYASPAPCVCP